MSKHTTARCSVALLLAVAAACSRRANNIDTSSAAGAIAPDTTAPAASAMTPVPPGVILTVASNAGTGMFIADGNGRALYILDRTPKDTNAWKPVSGAAAPTSTDTAVKANMMGTTTGASGAQATYAGKPLYYYSGDAAAGDIKGEDHTEAGATGHLVHPDGTMATGKVAGAKTGKMKHKM